MIRFFEPCPDVEGRGASVEIERIAREPAWLMERRRGPDPQTPPVESIWVEPGRASDGGASVYVPPRPVREFLEVPTEERARAYLGVERTAPRRDRPRHGGHGTVAAPQPSRSVTSPGTARAPRPASRPRSQDRFASLDSRSWGRARPDALVADERLAGRDLTVVYAFASWCPHSARQTPIVAAWARSRPDLPVVGLLLDSPPGAERQFDELPFPVQAGSPALRDQLGVRGYPTILFLRDGVPIEAISGVTPATRLEAMARGLGA